MYPQLKSLVVEFENSNGQNYGGYATSGKIVVCVGEETSPEWIKSVIIHEVQHVIQRMEGFAKGADPEFYERHVQKEDRVRLAEEVENILEEVRKVEYHGPTTRRPLLTVVRYYELNMEKNPDEDLLYCCPAN